MKKNILISICLSASLLAASQNSFKVFMKNGSVVDYSTSEVDSVVFSRGDAPVVNPIIPDDPEQKPSVDVVGDVQLTKVGGWLESGYAEWTPVGGATGYNVYCKPAGADESKYEKIDAMLVRSYGSYLRADVLGLKEGAYSLKVVPVFSGKESAKGSVATFSCKAHDRNGFAHFNVKNHVGAYNDDGTLKEGAVVIYITEKTKNTVSLDVYTSSTKTTSCTGVSAILKALQKGTDPRPICFRLIGKITQTGMCGSGDSNNMLVKYGSEQDKSCNITVEGVGEDATCFGFGIRGVRANGLEIRNLGIMEFGDDGIAFQDQNKHIWVHNVDIFYGRKGSDADQAKGDGSLDLKNDSQFMTLSYIHFWDSGKMSLCGMKSETGPNYISYHHNWFDHSDSRHPRVRTMSVHVYNNYFDGVSKYGVGATMGSSVFVEANYFRNTSKPMLSSKQGTDALGEGTFSGETGGVIKSCNNVFAEKSSNFSYLTQKNTSGNSIDAYEVDNRTEQVPSSVKTVAGGTVYNNFDTDSKLMYNVTPDDPKSVPQIVMKYAGRLNGGDFKWTFDNSVDDASYDVNAKLQAAVQGYSSKLVSILGE